MPERSHIPSAVTNRLYALSGNRCAFPGCRNEVTAHGDMESPVTVGQRAHIVGVGRQGPRSQAVDVGDIDDISNLLLLCHSCHARVDENPRIYSVEVLAKYKADHERRIAGGRDRRRETSVATETVDVSILPITEIPDWIYSAPSALRTTLEVVERLPRARRRDVTPFVLVGGRVWAFHDLSESNGPFAHAVRRSSSRQLTIAELAGEHRAMYVWLLNGALREFLRRRGVKHDRSHDRYYFIADHETVERRVIARSKLGRAQPKKKVVRREGERSGNLKDIWWHLAAQLRFEQFGPAAWGMTIRPEFHLTNDGTEPLASARVGRKITSRKSRMYNDGYFDAVHFFRFFLTDGSPELVLKTGRQRIVIDGEFPSVDARWARIDDKRFEPAPLSDDEDDLLDAVRAQWEVFEDLEWGAEPGADEQ